MSHLSPLREDFSAQIDDLIHSLNACISVDYKTNFKAEMNQGEFKPCCNEQEKQKIQYCYDQFMENNASANQTIVLKAIILMYYVGTVLEYYVVYDNECLEIFKGKQKDEINNIVANIVLGNDPYHSYLRKHLLGMLTKDEISGGRRKKHSRKKRRKSRSIRR
jgi:hypothetical protein